MQKYVIVSFLEPTEIAQEFAGNKWPLHITLAANFTTKLDATLLADIKARANQTKPIGLVAGAEEYFGKNKNVLVNPLLPSPSLISLHTELINLLSAAGAVFDEPGFIREGFRAHATVQPKSRLHQNDEIVIDRLSLVDMFDDPVLNKRKVLETFKFKA